MVLVRRSSLLGELWMKTTRYFEEQVLVKRPYLKREWCQQAIQNPVRREIEQNGRIRHWLYIFNT